MNLQLDSSSSNDNVFLKVLVSFLVVSIIVTSVLFFVDMNKLNDTYSDLNKIEYISSSTQRTISLKLTKQMLQRDIFSVGDVTEKTLKFNGDDAMSVLEISSMLLLANDVVDSWASIEALLLEDEPNVNVLALARDSHFQAMTNLSNEINSYAGELSDSISRYQIIMAVLVIAIAIIMLNNLLRTHTELKLSQAMAESAQIDMSTGLYNRSRCQELFKGNHEAQNKKQPAIVVLDLNDLKKTNDTQGHRTGDELIQSFANVLKAACAVHTIPPFIGRYGGDEFIVFYENLLNQEEIDIYLKELVFLTEQFNESETRFQLSYAVGYSYLSNKNDEKLTIRQLFDRADVAMYENKIAGKKAKNPNYEAEAAKGEVR